MNTFIHLVTPIITNDAAFLPLLDQALSGPRIASLWLRCGGATDKDRQRIAQALVPVAQARGTAVMVDAGDPRFAARAGADGLHLNFEIDLLEQALSSLKPDRVVGVGGLDLRDNAMIAGEMGADYVMFGEPDAAGQTPLLSSVLERCAWWSEIFNTPCIGYAPNAGAIAPIIATGVEFVGLGDWVFAGDTTTILAAAVAACKG